MRKAKYKKMNKLNLRSHKKKLKRTTGFIVDVAVAGAIISTAKGLR